MFGKKTRGDKWGAGTRFLKYTDNPVSQFSGNTVGIMWVVAGLLFNDVNEAIKEAEKLGLRKIYSTTGRVIHLKTEGVSWK